MNKTFADFYMSYQDGIDISNLRGKSEKLCKISGYISTLGTENLESNVSAISDFNFVIYSFGTQKKYEVTSMGVMNNLVGDDVKEAGLINKINVKNYNPQLGDYLVAKINPENNYINELFVMNGKNINEISEFMKTLKEPYCTGNIIKEIKQEPPKVQPIHNTQNYYLFGIIIFLLVIIVFGVRKMYFSKK